MRGEPLREHPRTLLALLDAAAHRAPSRPFLVERDAHGVWHQLAFATLAERSRRVGAALLALGASERRPVMILSGNGIDHAMVTFGALRAGIPVAPVAASAARTLRAFAEIVRPGVVFARGGVMHAAAVRVVAPGAAYVTADEPDAGPRTFDYARLLAHEPLAPGAVAVGPETVAKIMLTADASGEAKGVVVTHGMICAMLQGIAQAWPFLDAHPPVVVDRLPWSHGIGGNAVLGLVLRGAGTLYVDDANSLRAEIPPTLAFDVPLGWAAWVERLRGDDALRRRWLSQLDRACWTGATLAPATRDALRAIGVPLVAAWGATETSPAVTLTTGVDPKYDALGVPLAGVELKLVPSGDAYEARVRGPQVTPGYYWRPDLTAAAFDDEGFYRTGDVVRPIDARKPERGIEHVARTDDRFKLSSGVWVRAADLSLAFLAECSDVADVLVTGDGRDEVGLLVWPTAAARVLDRDLLRAQIADAMRRVAANGAAERPQRALLVAEPPSVEERTPHDGLLRRAALARRAAAVARLHASLPDAEVIVI
ncbi:MAG: AMP-binding protein [Candidatus Eremiobacteraeota bacterium]|nr:AMP-binding protein [Candidatus Eremiobacteraeota bacterium]